MVILWLTARVTVTLSFTEKKFLTISLTLSFKKKQFLTISADTFHWRGNWILGFIPVQVCDFPKIA